MPRPFTSRPDTHSMNKDRWATWLLSGVFAVSGILLIVMICALVLFRD